jgi:hypothetical protein
MIMTRKRKTFVNGTCLITRLGSHVNAMKLKLLAFAVLCLGLLPPALSRRNLCGSSFAPGAKTHGPGQHDHPCS